MSRNQNRVEKKIQNLCVVCRRKVEACGVFERDVLVSELVNNFLPLGHIFYSYFMCIMMELLGFSC